jgi:hypothetical protein
MTDILMMMFSMWALGTGTVIAENSNFGFSNLEFRTEADIRKELHGFKLQTELLEKYALINDTKQFSFFPKLKPKYKAYLLYRAGWGENEQPPYIQTLKKLKEKRNNLKDLKILGISGRRIIVQDIGDIRLAGVSISRYYMPAFQEYVQELIRKKKTISLLEISSGQYIAFFYISSFGDISMPKTRSNINFELIAAGIGKFRKTGNPTWDTILSEAQKISELMEVKK